jgi:hypothetical protein
METSELRRIEDGWKAYMSLDRAAILLLDRRGGSAAATCKFEISVSSVKDLAGGLVVIEWGELNFLL